MYLCACLSRRARVCVCVCVCVCVLASVCVTSEPEKKRLKQTNELKIVVCQRFYPLLIDFSSFKFENTSIWADNLA